MKQGDILVDYFEPDLNRDKLKELKRRSALFLVISIIFCVLTLLPILGRFLDLSILGNIPMIILLYIYSNGNLIPWVAASSVATGCFLRIYVKNSEEIRQIKLYLHFKLNQERFKEMVRLRIGFMLSLLYGLVCLMFLMHEITFQYLYFQVFFRAPQFMYLLFLLLVVIIMVSSFALLIKKGREIMKIRGEMKLGQEVDEHYREFKDSGQK